MDFERQWMRGPRPQIEAFLPEVDDPCWWDLLTALLEVEWEFRADAEETSEAADYCSRFPRARTFIESRLSASSTTPTEASAAAGFRVAHYDVLEELGRGGMSVVYRAYDTRLNRQVAMKVILGGHLASEQDSQRFDRETKALAQLDHPGIVPAYETGEWAGNRFLTMPLIEGSNLAELLRRQPVSWQQSVDIAVSIADALHHAHERGVVHRDLTPRNVLIDHAGRVRTADFGLAKLMHAESPDGDSRNSRGDLTISGQILGTPDYMSPEQAAGLIATIGPATDIHGLGAILYELLTGRRPFESPTLWDTLRLVRTTDPASPHSVNARVPRDLSTVCMKCLEKDPRRRYASAAEVKLELNRVLSGEPIRARTISRRERAWRWCHRNRHVSVLGTLVGCLLVALTAGAIVAALKFRHDEEIAREAQARSEAAERGRRQELFRVYLSESKMADATNKRSTRSNAVTALSSALEVTPWSELSTNERGAAVDSAIPWMTQAALVERRRVPLGNSQVRSDWRLIDVDPSFGRITLPCDGAGAQTTALDGSSPRDFAASADAFDDSPGWRGFSNDGKWLIEVGYQISAASSQRVRVWNRVSGELVFTRAFDEVGFAPLFHPNGRDLLYLYRNKLQVYRLDDGRLVSESSARFRTGKSALSSDGRLLAIASVHAPLEILDCESWNSLAVYPHLPETTSVAWQPELHCVVLGLADGRVAKIDPQRPSHVEFLDTTGRGTIDQITISSDGILVASSDPSGQAEIHDLTTGEFLAAAQGYPLRFGAEGRQLAMLDGADLVMVEVVLSSSYRNFSVTGDYAQFSPDGALLAVSGVRGVRLLRAVDGSIAADLGLDHCGPVAFRPDGSALATFGCFSHVQKWPLIAHVGKLEVGPPVRVSGLQINAFDLAPQHGGRSCAFAPGSEKLVIGDYRRSRLMVQSGESPPSNLADILSPTQVAVHPSGRWVAVGDRLKREAVVVDIESKQPQLRVQSAIAVEFSSDSRWLAARTHMGIEVHAVGTWERLRSIPLPVSGLPPALPIAFQPGGQLLAVGDASEQIKLFHVQSGREVATLRDKQQARLTSLCFRPDGSCLAACRPDRLALWDLAELRRELESLGMESGDLPSAVATGAPPSDVPLIQVDRGALPAGDRWHQSWIAMARYEAAANRFPDAIENLNKAQQQIAEGDSRGGADLLIERGMCHFNNDGIALARQDWDAALELELDEPKALQSLACLYLLAPPPFRNYEEAAKHSRRIGPAELDPAPSLIEAAAAVGKQNADERQLELLQKAALADDQAISRAISRVFLVLAAINSGQTSKSQAELEAIRQQLSAADRTMQHGQRRELLRWVNELSLRLSQGNDSRSSVISENR